LPIDQHHKIEGKKKFLKKNNITEEGGFYKIRVYETPENPTSETLTLGEY